MNTEIHDNELLSRRVHELQQEVRHMKRWGIGAIAVLVVLLSLQGYSHRKFSVDEVVAKSVTLTDLDVIVRARLAVFTEGAGLEAYAPSGERRIQLVGRGEGANLNLNIPITASQDEASVNLLHNNELLSSFRANANGASLELHSKTSNGTAALSLQGTTASLTLSGAAEKVPRVYLSADPSQACTALTGEANSPASSTMCLHSPGLPSLELSDVGGNRAVVGIPHSAEMNAEDGASEGTAASLILKHKSGSRVHVQPPVASTP